MTERDPSTTPKSVHDAAEKWLLRRQRGLDARSEARFQAWLEQATIHRIAYAQANELWQDSARLNRDELGIDRQLRRAPLFMRARPRAIAGAIGVVAALGLVSTTLLSHFTGWSVVPAAAAELVSSKLGEIRRVRLRDGTTLILDTTTSAAVRFDHGAPHLSLLRGRLRVDRKRAGERALKLAVGDRELSTVDAVFDVDLTGSKPEVQVYRGSVSVTPPIDGGMSILTSRFAGHLPGHRNQSSQQVGPRSDWTSGMLACDATPLSNAVTGINRYNAIKIVLADRSLSPIRISGAFRVTDPIGFANVVARMYHLSIRRLNERTIELSAPEK